MVQVTVAATRAAQFVLILEATIAATTMATMVELFVPTLGATMAAAYVLTPAATMERDTAHLPPAVPPLTILAPKWVEP